MVFTFRHNQSQSNNFFQLLNLFLNFSKNHTACSLAFVLNLIQLQKSNNQTNFNAVARTFQLVATCVPGALGAAAGG